MNVLLPVLYCPSSSTDGLASKSPSLSSGLQGQGVQGGREVAKRWDEGRCSRKGGAGGEDAGSTTYRSAQYRKHSPEAEKLCLLVDNRQQHTIHCT